MNWVSVDSGNGLPPIRRQTITWTNADLLSIGQLGTNFSEISIKIQIFSLKKMLFKISSAIFPPNGPGRDEFKKCNRPFYAGPSVAIYMVFASYSWITKECVHGPPETVIYKLMCLHHFSSWIFLKHSSAKYVGIAMICGRVSFRWNIHGLSLGMSTVVTELLWQPIHFNIENTVPNLICVQRNLLFHTHIVYLYIYCIANNCIKYGSIEMNLTSAMHSSVVPIMRDINCTHGGFH